MCTYACSFRQIISTTSKHAGSECSSNVCVRSCCCNRRDSFISPFSAGHIQQRFSSLFHHHDVVRLHCWLHGLYSPMLFPFFMQVGYLLECIQVTTSNTLFPAPLKAQPHRVLVSQAGLVFPACLFRTVCERQAHTIAPRRIGSVI